MKESYKYPNPIYFIPLMLIEKKKNKKKVIPYFKLGNHQVLSIYCLVWSATLRNEVINDKTGS